MDLGRSHPKIAELDSLFSAEDSDDSIRQQVLAYEAALLRHAELQLRQQQLTQEQEALLECLKYWKRQSVARYYY